MQRDTNRRLSRKFPVQLLSNRILVCVLLCNAYVTGNTTGDFVSASKAVCVSLKSVNILHQCLAFYCCIYVFFAVVLAYRILRLR